MKYIVAKVMKQGDPERMEGFNDLGKAKEYARYLTDDIRNDLQSFQTNTKTYAEEVFSVKVYEVEDYNGSIEYTPVMVNIIKEN